MKLILRQVNNTVYYSIHAGRAIVNSGSQTCLTDNEKNTLVTGLKSKYNISEVEEV